jgi:starvation-inducible DNA-binding protein
MIPKMKRVTEDVKDFENKSETPEVVRALTGVLGSTYVLYQKSLFYHWNVRGANFYGLHKLFEEHYEALHKAGDVIAERIRALGYTSPGTLWEFLSVSAIKEDDELPKDATAMIRNLVNSQEICANQARDAHQAAKQASDQATMDLLVNRMAFHEKSAWMLHALLADEKSEQALPIERL